MTVPEQQFSTLIPWMVEKFGKKFSVYGSRNGTEWTQVGVTTTIPAATTTQDIGLFVVETLQTVPGVKAKLREWLDALQALPQRRWHCACGELVEGGFESCWNCGRAMP